VRVCRPVFKDVPSLGSKHGTFAIYPSPKRRKMGSHGPKAYLSACSIQCNVEQCGNAALSTLLNVLPQAVTAAASTSGMRASLVIPETKVSNRLENSSETRYHGEPEPLQGRSA